jgi:hypothetical protein
MYLVTLGYDLMTASIIMTLMLLAGVAGQVMGGHISDRIGRKEFMIFGLAGAIPFFYLFFASTGIIAIIAILLFGFFLWSTFAVAVAMSHELLPHNRIWGPGCSGQWYDRRPLLSRCSPGNDPNPDCCSDAAYDYPSLPVEIIKEPSCRQDVTLIHSIHL